MLTLWIRFTDSRRLCFLYSTFIFREWIVNVKNQSSLQNWNIGILKQTYKQDKCLVKEFEGAVVAVILDMSGDILCSLTTQTYCWGSYTPYRKERK